jgi:hypothetical protein
VPQRRAIEAEDLNVEAVDQHDYRPAGVRTADPDVVRDPSRLARS